jgi:hypothetical protein
MTKEELTLKIKEDQRRLSLASTNSADLKKGSLN